MPGTSCAACKPHNVTYLPYLQRPARTVGRVGYLHLGCSTRCRRALTSRLAPRCRFPDSESSSHFWANLRDGRDMVTLDGRRWPAGLHNTPGRFGKLIEFDRFDASFFSVHGKQAQVRARG